MQTVEQFLERKDLIFLVQVAEKMGYSREEIGNMLSDNMDNFKEYEDELRIRICDAGNCEKVFDEGFLTEGSNVFCSEECCYNSLPNVQDDDFGESILYTNWYEETLISR